MEQDPTEDIITSQPQLLDILKIFKPELLAEICRYLYLQSEDGKIFPYVAGDNPTPNTLGGKTFPIHIATVRLMNFCRDCGYQYESAEDLYCFQCGHHRQISVEPSDFEKFLEKKRKKDNT